MIAYNRSDIENNLLSKEAKMLYKGKFISKEKQKNISAQLDAFKTTENWFVRLAFFLLGSFLYSSVLGSTTFFLMTLIENNFNSISFLYFIIGIIGAEIIAKQNYFKHGLDDAFIIGLQIAIGVAVGVTTKSNLLVYSTIFIVSIACSIRYVHTISALSACIGILFTIFYAITEYKIINALFLPFLGVILAIVLFIISKKLIKKSDIYIYKNAIQIVEIFSYFLAYFSLNYLVVRELSIQLLQIEVTKNNDIPFAIVFYIFTFLTPVFFFYFSLKHKERILFYASLLTFSFSIFTIRYYYSIMPIEIALTIGGAILFVATYCTIRYLKNKQTGITFKEDRNSEKSIFLNAQAIIINSQTSSSQNEIAQNDMEFGGGKFSGGGSGGNF